MVHHFYDETAGHPVVVAPMSERRPFWRSVLTGAYVELVSIAGRSALAAARAGKPTDFVDRIVTVGDVSSIEPWGTDCVIAGLVHFKYMTHLGDGVFQLNQHPMLTHSRTAMQLWWAAQEKKDTLNEALRAQVRWRDGDQCRVCREEMLWGKGSDKSPRGGTLDHRVPGEAAESADDLAAVCRTCNGIRSDRADANEFAPWQPVPEKPWYSASTSRWLREAGYSADPTGAAIRAAGTGKQHKLDRITIVVRPTSQVDTALSDLETIEVPLPSQWDWEAHKGGSGCLCDSRPNNQLDTAPQPLTEAPVAPESTVSDLTTGEIPLDEERPQNVGKTPPKHEAVLPPDPPFPRTNPAPPRGGRQGGEGVGREGFGSGLVRSGPGKRRRSRGRRARSSSQQVQPREQS